MNPRIWVVTLALAASAFAGSADEDWQAVLALDAGPQTPVRTSEEAQSALTAHLAAQDRALRTFITAHSGDAREFEARLRLARLTALRSEILNDAKSRAEPGHKK